MESRLENIKEKREEFINYLKDEKITGFEWENLIKNYIDQKYKESTL